VSESIRDANINFVAKFELSLVIILYLYDDNNIISNC